MTQGLTLPMHEEGAFLLLESAQPWDDPVPSEWVLYMGDDADRGPVGWTICFDEQRDEGSWDVDVLHEVALDSPPMPATRFLDVVEVSARGAVTLMDGDWETHAVASADDDRWLRVRISREQPDGARPKLLVQTWPAEPVGPQVLRRSEEQALDLWQLALPEAPAGLAGADRIGRDVDLADGHRRLSGEVGTATVTADIPGRLSRLTNLFEAGNIWTPALNGYSATRSLYTDTDGETWSTCFVDDASHPDHIAGTSRSAILTRPRVEHDPPRLSALWWRWGRPVPPLHPTLNEPAAYSSVQDADARLDVTYERTEDKSTKVTVQHSGVPIEWVDDVASWWTYQLAIARRSFGA